MFSDLMVVPPERIEAQKCLERLRARSSAFELIYDSTMEIYDHYFGVVGPVGESRANADCTPNR